MELSATAIIGAINLILIILVGLFNWFSHNKIVGNDLHHLSADVREIKEKQVGIEKYVVGLATDLATVKGRCEMNTCKPFRTSTKKSKKI